MTELAREAAEAAKRLQERGIDLAGSGKQGETGDGSEGAEGGDAGAGDPVGEQVGENGQPAGDADGGAADGQLPPNQNGTPVGEDGKNPKPGNGGAPPGTPPPGDDDIVARQLREAAEREKDPVMREKLWREYRAYKEGISGGN